MTWCGVFASRQRLKQRSIDPHVRESIDFALDAVDAPLNFTDLATNERISLSNKLLSQDNYNVKSVMGHEPAVCLQGELAVLYREDRDSWTGSGPFYSSFAMMERHTSRVEKQNAHHLLPALRLEAPGRERQDRGMFRVRGRVRGWSEHPTATTEPPSVTACIGSQPPPHASTARAPGSSTCFSCTNRIAG